MGSRGTPGPRGSALCRERDEHRIEMRLSGRKALVTGSNRGIGAGIALRLAREGADVAINYLEGDAEAEEVAEAIRGLGCRAVPARADLRDPEAIERMMADAIDRLAGLDILVNNAGI